MRSEPDKSAITGFVEHLILERKRVKLKELVWRQAPAGKCIDPLRWYRVIAIDRAKRGADPV